MKNKFKKELLKIGLGFLVIPAMFMSWVWYGYKTYTWYKPHVGETFSELLPDLTMWNIFAIGVVLSALMGNSPSKVTLNRIYKNTDKEKEEKFLKIISNGLLVPWGLLLVHWILYSLIF